MSEIVKRFNLPERTVHRYPCQARVVLVLLACFGFVVVPKLAAQAFEGKIIGTVTDPTGALVPDASVKAIETAQGVETTVRSNARGEYSLSSLNPGMYSIRVEKAGFELFEGHGVELQVNQTIQLDVSLVVGRSVESIEISAGAQQLETHDASLGQVVTTTQIEELPLAIRSPLDLISLTPGAVLGPDFGANGNASNIGRNFNKSNFNVGGGKSGSQAIMIDGAPDTTADQGRALINPPVDSVQEFKVQAASYDAQFGRTSGGIINIVSKSGSNAIHGSVYDFERDSVFDATNYFSDGNTTSYHLRQAGGVLGFPVLKERWFGFADFESLNQGNPVTSVATVPTDAQRAGDFTETTYTKPTPAGGAPSAPALVVIYDPATYNPVTGLRSQTVGCDGITKNVICSSRISTLSSNLVGLYPHANLPGDVNNGSNFSYTANQYTTSYKYDFRSDINIRGKTTLFAKFSRQTDHRQVPGTLPPANSGSVTTDVYTQIILGATRVITSNLVASATTSFVRGLAIQVGTAAPVDITTLGFSPHFASEATLQVPIMAMSNQTDLTFKSNVNQQHQPRNTYATLGQLTYLHGHQSVKFGGEWWVLNFNEYQNSVSSGSLTFNTSFTQHVPGATTSKLQGYDVASLLLGIPSGINQTSFAEGSYIRRVQAISTGGIYYAAFVQDDYRATDKLTLNVGLRWDVNIGDREKYDRLAWFDPSAPSPLGPTLGNNALKGVVDWVGHGNDRDQQKTSWTNLNPRIGFAYHVQKNLVVRGGYGIFFLPRSIQGSDVGALGTTVDTEVPVDGNVPTTSLADPFPSGVRSTNNDRSPLADVGQSLSIPTHDFKAAYVQLFSLGFQEQLPWGILGDIHYWGNIGTHIPTTANLNALPDQYVATNTAQAAALNVRVANPLYGFIPLQPTTVTMQQTLLPFSQYTGAIAQQLVPVGRTNYNALTMMASKRLSNSLSFTTQYTWGKAMDDLGTPLDYANRRPEYGASSLDVTNQFISSFVAQLPYGHGRHWGQQSGKWMNRVFGGWNVNGIVNMQTGFPVTVSRPLYVAPGSKAHLANPKPAPNYWFNAAGLSSSPSDFSKLTGTAFTYGNEPRNLKGVRSDHMRNVNVNIEKNFYTTWHGREVKTQIRAESYNVFNHPQFAAPIGTFSSVNFGEATTQLNTPRQFQFAAKVMF